jgi:hypothetical protein
MGTCPGRSSGRARSASSQRGPTPVQCRRLPGGQAGLCVGRGAAVEAADALLHAAMSAPAMW